MLVLRIVEHLNVVEHILPGVGPSLVGTASYPFSFEQVEEALHDSIIIAVQASAHRVLQTVRLEKCCPVHAGELGNLIRMDQHAGLRLSSLYPHQQCMQDHIRRMTALHGPADYTAGMEINHHGQIGKALQCPDIGYVRHPGPIRCVHVELPV